MRYNFNVLKNRAIKILKAVSYKQNETRSPVAEKDYCCCNLLLVIKVQYTTSKAMQF